MLSQPFLHVFAKKDSRQPAQVVTRYTCFFLLPSEVTLASEYGRRGVLVTTGLKFLPHYSHLSLK